MRVTMILLALAGLSACDREVSESEKASVAATPAQLTYEGGDYKDEAAKLAHGKRLAVVLDCTGCHRSNLQGQNVTRDDPKYGEMNAPNLTLKLAEYHDEDFKRLMREGVPKDGREFWFMPVESFQFLSDRDLDALFAYLRTFKPAGTQLPPIRKGAGFYKDIERGFGNSRQQVARYRAKPPPDLGEQHAWGRHLAETVCTACHNSELQGYPGFTPSLDLAGAYSPAELETLLTTGKGKSKPDLGMMSEVARASFSRFTPAERQAIIAYLKARADRFSK
jgi:mono/diheme cytochrome c family protein